MIKFIKDAVKKELEKSVVLKKPCVNIFKNGFVVGDMLRLLLISESSDPNNWHLLMIEGKRGDIIKPLQKKTMLSFRNDDVCIK